MTTVSHRLVFEDSGVHHDEATSAVLSTLTAPSLGASAFVLIRLTAPPPEVVQLPPVDSPRTSKRIEGILSLVAALRLASCRMMRNGPITCSSPWLTNYSWRASTKSNISTNLSLIENRPEYSLVDWVGAKRQYDEW